MTVHATEGRRRADDLPTVGPAPAIPVSTRPIDAAIDHVSDRQSRTEYALDELGSVIANLTDRLTYVLADGQPATYPEDPGHTVPIEKAPEDRRSTVTKAITGLALRADRQADAVQAHTLRLRAILDALEV